MKVVRITDNEVIISTEEEVEEKEEEDTSINYEEKIAIITKKYKEIWQQILRGEEE